MLLNCGVGEDSWTARDIPWTARRSNQSILKEISSEYSLEGLMLKLKLQYFGHLMGRTDSLEKTLKLGKIEGRRRRGWQRMRCWMASPTWWIWVWISSGSWWWTGKPGCSLWGCKELDTIEWLNWTGNTLGVISFHWSMRFDGRPLQVNRHCSPVWEDDDGESVGGFGNKEVGLDLTEKGGDGGYRNLDVGTEGFCIRQRNLLQKMHRGHREHISFIENCK